MSNDSILSEIAGLGKWAGRLLSRNFGFGAENNLKPGYGYDVIDIEKFKAVVHSTEIPLKEIEDELQKHPDDESTFFVYVHGKGSGGHPKLIGVILVPGDAEGSSFRTECEIETNWRSRALTPEEIGLRVNKDLVKPLPMKDFLPNKL
ncbi:MAG: hypothetical protein AAGB32_02740 [Pseudomonadota bacterium]